MYKIKKPLESGLRDSESLLINMGDYTMYDFDSYTLYEIKKGMFIHAE